MTPNSPRALPKISITRILTKRVEFCASDRAQLLPIIPTHSLCETEREGGENQQRDKIKMYLKSDIMVVKQNLNSPTDKICKTHDDSRCKYSIACSEGLWVINLRLRHTVQLCLKNDSHDDSIYGNSLTENHTGRRVELDRASSDIISHYITDSMNVCQSQLH